MVERPEAAAAGSDDPREAARKAIERHLISREAHWKGVAEEAEGGPDAEEWQKSWVDAQRRLSRWQRTGETDDDTAAEAAQNAWNVVEHLRSEALSALRADEGDEAREEYVRSRRSAEFIEEGLRQLGYDIEVERALPLDHEPGANG